MATGVVSPASPGVAVLPAINVRGLSKSFRRLPRRRGHTTLKTTIVNVLRGRREPIPLVEVLRSIDLQVPRGTTLGMIGRNGSGKSTLLRILAGIYRPGSGTVTVRGRVSALIELGAGFHPEFTGRENVFVNGMILGLTRREIRERFEQIVEFAGLGDVIDNPVRTYSSGMYMRLGFAVAVNVDPEVFLIDEVLAVGDASFLPKCEARMHELRAQGTTMVIASHDMKAVARWCDQVIWLDRGAIAAQGPPREAIAAYERAVAAGAT